VLISDYFNYPLTYSAASSPGNEIASLIVGSAGVFL
jgi:hypothetical protein